VRIAGNYTFDATREEVWSALNDPEVLARTIPGCQRLDQVGENEFESTLKVGLQAVRGTYNGRVKLSNLVAPESYEVSVDGKGSNGFLKGSGTIKLRDEGAQTILDYGGEAQIGGTIASVGQRLIDGAAKTLINQSLKALAQQIADRRNPPPAPSAPEAAESPAKTIEATASSASSAVAAKVESAGAAVGDKVASASAAVADTAKQASAAVADTAKQAGAAVAERAEQLGSTVAEATASGWQPRSITVPPGQGLSEADLARGAAEDFLKERPWLPWVALAFLIGFMLGRRK
jgi:carbon monoxide dehydrogenase subunit G